MAGKGRVGVAMSIVFRNLSFLVFMMSFSAASFGVTHAQSGTCSGLSRQLVAAGSGQRVESKTNDRAVVQARINLQEGRMRAKRDGCAGFLFDRGDPAVCKRHERNIAKISATLTKLENRNGKHELSRQQIVRLMDAKGCNRGQVAGNPKAAGPERRTFFDVLFGPRQEANAAVPGKDNRRERPNVSAPSERLKATYEGDEPGVNGIVKKGYRTLCVRTCDGYYFPISFSTKPKFFARDQNACTAMCPAGNAKLFYHAVPEQESDAMISVTGQQPYSELPNAFNYRTVGLKAVPGCSCQGVRSVEIRTDETEQADVSVSDELNDDPAQGDADEFGVQEREVRTVGPAFLPDNPDPDFFKTQEPEKEPRRTAGILTPENIVRTIASDIMRRVR